MASKARRRAMQAVFLLLMLALGIWWLRARRPAPEYASAYVVEPSAIVWNSNAQVRQPVITLHYGDRVSILQQSGERTEVRSDSAEGWIEASTLMDADLWQQAAQLLSGARAMPAQARGHTRTISNVRLTPGRDGGRIFQFGRNEPVVVLDRKTGPAPQEGTGEAASATDNVTKLEDWLLVLRAPATGATATLETTAAAPSTVSPATSNATAAVPIAGWVLARFIELDPPPPLPDYFNAAGIRVVAWAVLNTVSDNGESHPQYLVAGAHGGEGQPCDFTLLRVYTWGAARQRYETAYIENDICGRMPIRVASTPQGDEFRFADAADSKVERVYRMRQTSVRRVTEGTAETPRPPTARPKKRKR